MVVPSRLIDRRRFLGLTAMASTAIHSPLAWRQGVSAKGTTTAPHATPATTVFEDAIISTMETHTIPGANILLDRPDTGTWTAALGFSDLQSLAPMSPTMHMRIGSITKTMTATVVLQLVDEGVFTLDDTLAALLPEATLISNSERITVRDLLSMRSGIFDLVDDESFFPLVLAEPTRAWSPDEMIAIAAKHEAEFAPGDGFGYSNTNFILLGMIVEAYVKRPIAAALAERIFTPLGMAHTSLPDNATLPEPFARGYLIDPRQESGEPTDWTEFNATAAWAAGGVVSTIGDLHIWLKSLVNGTLLSDALQRERLAFTPVERDPGEPPYGYGLGIASFDGKIGHDGSILGFNSIAVYDPETGASTIVLANLDPARHGIEAAGTIRAAIEGAH